MTAPCSCCAATGRIQDDRPLCPCAIQRRDLRSPDQLARLRYLQGVALRGIAYTDDGGLLPEHGRPFIDYRDGAIVHPDATLDARRHYPDPTLHPMTQPPAVDLFDATDTLESWIVRHVHEGDGALLDHVAAVERDYGPAVVADALTRARAQAGWLPDVLGDLLDVLTPDMWKGAV